jgi:DNA polymerase-3 subunit delta'
VRLSDVRHQDRALALLRRALRSGRTHHACLFAGPEGVGKELAARGLAARLLCQNPDIAPDADACGTCPACRLMDSDSHPDFHLIHRGLHKLHPEPSIRRGTGLFLVVDVIRHFLIQPAALKPALGMRRVFIIRDVERLNEQAQNALLKTLEEPPGAAVLILVTSSAARLLPTIRSRCQHIPFGLLPPAFVADELRARTSISADDAQALAGLSEGRLGVALRWQRSGLLAALSAVGAQLRTIPAGDPEAFGKSLVEIATDLARSGRATADEDEELEDEPDPDLADDAAPRGSAKKLPTHELRDALRLVLLLVGALHRDALLESTAAAPARLAPAEASFISALVAHSSLAQLDAALCAVSEAELMLERNVAPQLVCERLAVALLGELPVSG